LMTTASSPSPTSRRSFALGFAFPCFCFSNRGGRARRRCTSSDPLTRSSKHKYEYTSN
jgi:hypothetical protein